jgi:hypothetical protein
MKTEYIIYAFGLGFVILSTLVIQIVYNYKVRKLKTDEQREIEKAIRNCKHETKVLVGGGGENDSGWVYTCRKCGKLFITD